MYHKNAFKILLSGAWIVALRMIRPFEVVYARKDVCYDPREFFDYRLTKSQKEEGLENAQFNNNS